MQMKNILKVGLILGLVVLLNGCTDKDGTLEVLKKQGYTHITTDGYAFFGCAKDDTFHTKFYAKSPSGSDVEGVACSSWFKGITLRFD